MTPRRLTALAVLASVIGSWLALAGCTTGVTPDCADAACTYPEPPPIVQDAGNDSANPG